jgi:hypothetical protein
VGETSCGFESHLRHEPEHLKTGQAGILRPRTVVDDHAHRLTRARSVPLKGETPLADMSGTDGSLARSFPSATAPRHGLILDPVTLTPLTGSKPIRIGR